MKLRINNRKIYSVLVGELFNELIGVSSSFINFYSDEKTKQKKRSQKTPYDCSID
jgi:hypothetical protein